MSNGSKLLFTRDPGDMVEDAAASSMLLNFFIGSFVEKIATGVTSDGVTVTFTLENADATNDLTMRFGDGFTILDVTPIIEFQLDAGTLASPTENYVFIPSSTKVLTKDNSDWPSGEHIKVAYCYVPAPADVQADSGSLIHQPWNDGSAASAENGHMLDIAERLRIGSGADWYSGVAGTGADNYLTITPGAPDTVTVQSGAGVVYQLHRHDFAAQDTSSGDNVHIVNHDTTPNVGLSDLADLTNDASGGSLSNKYFNVVLWGVANKGGTHSPLMLNLPTGTYNTESAAKIDADSLTVFDIPRQYFIVSTTGFLLARMLLRKQSAGGGTWTLVETEDLRGRKPGTVAGAGSGGTAVEFADNTFRVFDETTGFQFSHQLSGLTDNREVTALDAAGVNVLSDAVLTAESIPFADASGRLDEDLTLVRDAATGNIGIGIASPGAKLDVAGQIKITGGSPGAGKILTDVAGTGLATWETPAGGGGGGWADDGTTVRLETASDRVVVGAATGNGLLNVTGVGSEDNPNILIDGATTFPLTIRQTSHGQPFTFGGALSAETILRMISNSGGAWVPQAFTDKTSEAAIRMQAHAAGTRNVAPAFLIEAFGTDGGTGRTIPAVNDTSFAVYNGQFGGGGNVAINVLGDGRVGINKLAPVADFDVEGHGAFEELTIGATTAPGATGEALFEVHGTTSSSAGPHLNFVGSAQAQPIFGWRNWSPADITMLWGAYYGASDWRSSDAGSNFATRKVSNTFQINYDSGVAPGSAITWNSGIVLDTNGDVGVGTSSPGARFDVLDTDNGSRGVRIRNLDTGTGARAQVEVLSDSAGVLVGAASAAYATVTNWADAAFVNATAAATGGLKLRASGGGIGFSTDGGLTDDNAGWLDTNGNWFLGTTRSATVTAQLSLGGAAAPDSGVIAQYTNDDYPVIFHMGWAHDDSGILFDSYYNSGWKSSNSTSNYRLYKDTDFILDYDTGVAAGGTITWNRGWTLTDDGKFGIGVEAPDAKLHVFSASCGTFTPISSGDDLLVENSGHGGITVATPDASFGYLFFGSPSDTSGAYLNWNYSSGIMSMQATKSASDIQLNFPTDATAVHIDGGLQEVGVKTETPTKELHVQGDFYCSGSGTYVGTWTDVSDEALKLDMRPLAAHIGAIRDKFMAIVPIRYGFNPQPFFDAGSAPPTPEEDRQWGYSAQNLEAAGLHDLVLPITIGRELAPGDRQPGEEGYRPVGGKRTGPELTYKSVETGGIMALHTVVLQWVVGHAETTRGRLVATRERVVALEAKVNTLENQMAHAIARIQALESAQDR